MDIYSQIKKHLEIAPDVDVSIICKPLFENFGISYFSYNRVYSDGARIFLCTNNSFLDWVFKNDLTIANSMNAYVKDGMYFPKNSHKLMPKKEAEKGELQIVGGRNHFNIDLVEQSCTIIERPNANYCEIFDFAGPMYGASLIDFYISNIDVLKYFIHYFKAKANPLIKKLDKNRLCDPRFTLKNTLALNNEDIKAKKAAFYNATQLKHFQIQGKYNQFYLTKQEISCLSLLLRGRTAKQTAKNLKISPKTVEYYVDSAKQKLNCHDKSALIDKIIELNLFNPDYLKSLILQR